MNRRILRTFITFEETLMDAMSATQSLVAITLILMGGIGLALLFAYFQWRKLKKDDHLIP